MHACGFIAADSKPISHATLVSYPLEASVFRKQLAVVKVCGHDPVDSDSARGNCFVRWLSGLP